MNLPTEFCQEIRPWTTHFHLFLLWGRFSVVLSNQALVLLIESRRGGEVRKKLRWLRRVL